MSTRTLYIHTHAHIHTHIPLCRVAEVELQRDLLYEEEKGVCRALLSYLQKLSLSSPIEGTHGGTEQHTGATAPSRGELGHGHLEREKPLNVG